MPRNFTPQTRREREVSTDFPNFLAQTPRQNREAKKYKLNET